MHDDIPLPVNENAEKLAISCLLISNINECTFFLASLKDEYFMSGKMTKILYGVRKCIEEKKPIDIVTLSHYDIDALELMELQTLIATNANFDSYVEELKNMYARRQSIIAATKIITQSRDKTTDPTMISSLFSDTYKDLQDNLQDKKDRSIREVARSTLKEIQLQIINKGEDICTSGIDWMDDALKCKKGMMHCIAARPGIGKTSIALQRFTSQGINFKKKKIVAYFCRETKSENLMMKIAAQRMGIPLNKIMYCTDSTFLKEFTIVIKEVAITCENNAFLFGANDFKPTVQDIAIKCNTIYNKCGALDEVYIDYLTDLDSPKGFESYERGVAYNLSFLKDNIQIKFNTMLTILCQLGRLKDNKPPTMNDFQWSSKIEQITNIASVLHRDPEKYKQGEKLPDIIDTIWMSVKGRECPDWYRMLKFHGASNKFEYDMHRFKKGEGE